MKTKAVVIMALGMSIFTAATWAILFWTFTCGYSAWEPNPVIARLELTFTCLLTILAITGFVLYIKNLFLGR